MKFLILASLSFFAAHSFAQTSTVKPFELAAGSYTSECWHVSDSRSSTTTGTGADYTKGNVTVIIQGNTNIQYEQYVSELLPGQFSTGNSYSKVTTTDLGEERFKTVSEYQGTDTFDGQTDKFESKSEATLTVGEDRTTILTIKIDNQDEQPSVRETYWKTMADGRIFVQGYITGVRSVKTEDGRVRNYSVDNSSCIYSPVK
jgi:hypothetical protein